MIIDPKRNRNITICAVSANEQASRDKPLYRKVPYYYLLLLGRIIHTNNIKQTGIVTSEDNGRYFAEMDFDALDDTIIVRHHQLHLSYSQHRYQRFISLLCHRRRHLPIDAKNISERCRHPTLILYAPKNGASLWNNHQDDKKTSAGDDFDYSKRCLAKAG